LGPCVILFFPKFFIGSIEKSECCGKQICGEFSKGSNVQNMQVHTNDEQSDSIYSTDESPLFSQKKIETPNNFWRKFAKITQKSPQNFLFLILVIAIVIPFALFSCN
jgi:hypothetical protein